MSVVEPVSHEMCKVGHGPLQSNYVTDINKYTLEGNNKMINACITTIRSNRTSILRILLLIFWKESGGWDPNSEFF
jgi:hypothetical protein